MANTLSKFILIMTIFAAASGPSMKARADSLGGPESVSQTRFQPAVSTRGMVVADDEVAAQWGTEILRQGGNAVDAAVATAFMLAVTRPHYASLGGGGFLLYCPARAAQCNVIDYRETAPGASTRDMYIKNGKAQTELSQNGALASGVPGAPAGLLLALDKFGSLPRQKILKRPILVARHGYLFTPHSENAAKQRWSAMNDAARKIFGCGGYPCPPGTLVKQTDLSHVLQSISDHGASGFYQGRIARLISRGIQAAGGIITEKDLSAYEPKLRTPIRGELQDWEIVTMPPPSSGGGILLQLFGYAGRAEKFGAFRKKSTSEIVHALTHAMSLAFADRAYHYGDPDFVQVPLAELLNPEYLNKRWSTFHADRAALPDGAGRILSEHRNTTHFSVIDRQGNAVALTTTVNDNFGSGFVPPQTGLVMNNEMDDFSIQPGVPNQFGLIGDEANAIAPGKRPLSSMTPTIVRDKEKNNRIVIGAAGGPRITTSVFLSLFNRLLLDLPISDAVAAARFHHQWRPQTVLLEKFAISSEVKDALEKKGYTVSEVITLGKVHALERLTNGRVWGIADPRGEGEAVAE